MDGKILITNIEHVSITHNVNVINIMRNPHFG